jgi:hypothetical protein
VTDLVEYDVDEKIWHKSCVEICQRFGQLFLLGKAELAGIDVELEERHFVSREWNSCRVKRGDADSSPEEISRM